MRTALLFILLASCLPAQAQTLKFEPISSNECLYVGAMTVITHSPRVVQPRYYKVTPLTYSDMKRLSRVSVMHPYYDSAYSGTDAATDRIKFAVTTAMPCNKFMNKREAKKALEAKLKTWWNIATSMAPYKHVACCWGASVHKAH